MAQTCHATTTTNPLVYFQGRLGRVGMVVSIDKSVYLVEMPSLPVAVTVLPGEIYRAPRSGRNAPVPSWSTSAKSAMVSTSLRWKCLSSLSKCFVRHAEGCASTLSCSPPSTWRRCPNPRTSPSSTRHLYAMSRCANVTDLREPIRLVGCVFSQPLRTPTRARPGAAK